MKIASVVLVLQFIGYNSGVIVPSGVAKGINTLPLDTNSSISEIRLETKAKIIKQIDDKELYRTATEKKYNLTERSFIIINGRFKNHLRDQKTYSVKNQIIFSDQLYSKAQTVDQHHNKTLFNPTPKNVNPFAPLFIPHMKTKDNTKTKFAAALKYEPPKYFEPSKYQHNLEAHTARNLVTGHSQTIYIYPGKSLMRYANMKQASNLSEQKHFDNNRKTQKESHYPKKNTAQAPQSGKKLQTAAHLKHRLNYRYGLISPQKVSQQSINRDAGTSYRPEISTILEIGNPSDPIVERKSFLERLLDKFNQDIKINSLFNHTSESPTRCTTCKHMANNKTISKNCKCKTNNKSQNAQHFKSTYNQINPTISSYDYDSDEIKTMLD